MSIVLTKNSNAQQTTEFAMFLVFMLISLVEARLKEKIFYFRLSVLSIGMSLNSNLKGFCGLLSDIF